VTTAEPNTTDKAVSVAAPGAHVAPGKAPAKKAASQKKSAPQAQKSGTVAKTKAATPKKADKAGATASKKPQSANASRHPARREQGRDNPGDDRPPQGCHPRRDHEADRLAGAQRSGIHLDRANGPYPAKENVIRRLRRLYVQADTQTSK
jgi:hypothetical protein